MFTYEKQMAHCSVGYRHPYLHRQCLRLERTDKAYYAGYGFTLKETTWTFSIAILFLGLSAGFWAITLKIRPRKAVSPRPASWSGYVRMFGTALALHLNSLPLLYLLRRYRRYRSWDRLYHPVSTLVKWFPNNRGFATGLAIMGFGFASLIAGPLMQILVAKYGLVQNFIILGCVYMVIMAASALS